jgi:hypothetical protein
VLAAARGPARAISNHHQLIGKWLNAGVMEEGVIGHPESGTPQGAVNSPFWRTSICTWCSTLD